MKIRNFRIHFFHRYFGHIRVSCAVVSDNVAFVNHAPDKFRFGFCIGKSHEENRGNAFFFKHVKNFGSVSVFITFVKGKINFSFVLFAVPIKIRIPFGIFRLKPDAGYGFSGFVKVCSGAPGNLFDSKICKFLKIWGKFFKGTDFVFNCRFAFRFRFGRTAFGTFRNFRSSLDVCGKFFVPFNDYLVLFAISSV